MASHDQALTEFPEGELQREYRQILLATRIAGTLGAVVALCYNFAGLHLAALSLEAATPHFQMVVRGKDWWSDPAELALFSHTSIFAAGTALSLLAIAWLWVKARRIAAALYACCAAIIPPVVAGLVLHTGTHDVYDAIIQMNENEFLHWKAQRDRSGDG